MGMHQQPPFYGRPPPAAAQVPQQLPAPQISNIPADQHAMLQQVLNLTNEQLNALPAHERAAVEQLRVNYGGRTA